LGAIVDDFSRLLWWAVHGSGVAGQRCPLVSVVRRGWPLGHGHPTRNNIPRRCVGQGVGLPGAALAKCNEFGEKSALSAAGGKADILRTSLNDIAECPCLEVLE
jgi:hypothetical protein